jgi:hypothetical protein
VDLARRVGDVELQVQAVLAGVFIVIHPQLDHLAALLIGIGKHLVVSSDIE